MTVEIQKRDIRRNAARFAKRWAGTTRETAEAQTFWNEFFAIFGVDRKLVGQFELHARRVSTGGTGSIDLFLPQKMAVEHKSAGNSLDAAMTQLRTAQPSRERQQNAQRQRRPLIRIVQSFRHRPAHARRHDARPSPQHRPNRPHPRKPPPASADQQHPHPHTAPPHPPPRRAARPPNRAPHPPTEADGAAPSASPRPRTRPPRHTTPPAPHRNA